MYILGINAYHGDVSAVLVQDGELVAAVEEERFRRVKHWAGFPSESIRACLDMAGIRGADVHHIAVSRDPRAHLWRKAWYVATHRPRPSLLIDRLSNRRKIQDVAGPLRAALRVQDLPEVHYIEHHTAHLASAFFVSPFEEAAVCAVDGFGDFVSTSAAYGRGTQMDVLDRVFFPHSLGMLYAAVTQYLGFRNYGDEYKVMGLAPYGGPTHVDALRDLVRLQPEGRFELNLEYFRHHRDGIEMRWNEGSPSVGRVFTDALPELLGPVRLDDEPVSQFHMDVAHSVQVVYEEALFHILNALHERTGATDLALAGGCAMNSVANGKIRAMTPFERVYVQPAAGDNGTALGAAYAAWHELGGERRFVMDHAYWGPSFDPDDARGSLRRAEYRAVTLPPPVNGASGEKISAAAASTAPSTASASPRTLSAQTPSETHAPATLSGRRPAVEWELIRTARAYGDDSNFESTVYGSDAGTCRAVAALLAKGAVVGWFRGRMEWGARALGNRSILADPRRSDVRELINEKIKFRELFRPFAPAVLEEHVEEYFVDPAADPFMQQVYPVRPEKRRVIPAVTHVDGSGRLQAVSRASNPAFHQLISEFALLTGVPVLLNTSFNENEPIVHTPREALDCFLRTRMDAVVIGNRVVRRLPNELTVTHTDSAPETEGEDRPRRHYRAA